VWYLAGARISAGKSCGVGTGRSLGAESSSLSSAVKLNLKTIVGYSQCLNLVNVSLISGVEERVQQRGTLEGFELFLLHKRNPSPVPTQDPLHIT